MKKNEDKTVLIDKTPTIEVNTNLVVAADNLVKKLQEMYKHPDFQATFVLASLYQNPYNGPSAISEMLVLQDELNKIGSGQKLS